MKKELFDSLEKSFNTIINGPPCLDKAILLAVLAHSDHRDQGGAPYIRHCLRVMEKQRQEDEQVPAVLHDVVEDTWISIQDLRDLGWSTYQISVVNAMTKREGEPYGEYLDRVKKFPTAKKIKIADLKDNLQLWRLKNGNKLQPKDLRRIQKYIEALHELGEL